MGKGATGGSQGWWVGLGKREGGGLSEGGGWGRGGGERIKSVRFQQGRIFEACPYILKSIIMQLSIDEKIQAAIEPLLTRIAALEADCAKFKEEIATLQNPAPKPTPKPAHKPAEPVRPDTTKGNRKKSVEGQDKTDKKAPPKKEESKPEGEDGNKSTQLKPTPTSVKPVPSPVVPKDANASHDSKAVKPVRPPTAVGGPKPKPGEIGNKSVVHDKKIVGGKTEQEGEKKEGEEEHNGEKVETKPTTTAGHSVKSPAVTKVKPAPPTDKKTAPPPSSVKKGGKSPAVDPKKKEPEVKTEEKKEEPVVAEHSDESIAQASSTPVEEKKESAVEAAVEKVEENPYTPAAGESKVEEPAAEVAAEVAVEVASETVAEEKPAEGESF